MGTFFLQKINENTQKTGDLEQKKEILQRFRVKLHHIFQQRLNIRIWSHTLWRHKIVILTDKAAATDISDVTTGANTQTSGQMSNRKSKIFW